MGRQLPAVADNIFSVVIPVAPTIVILPLALTAPPIPVAPTAPPAANRNIPSTQVPVAVAPVATPAPTTPVAPSPAPVATKRKNNEQLAGRASSKTRCVELPTVSDYGKLLFERRSVSASSSPQKKKANKKKTMSFVFFRGLCRSYLTSTLMPDAVKLGRHIFHRFDPNTH
jgi:hypothetical protein